MAPFVCRYGIRKYKKAKKLHFKLKLEGGKPGGSNRAGNQIQAASLIKVGALTALF